MLVWTRAQSCEISRISAHVYTDTETQTHSYTDRHTHIHTCTHTSAMSLPRAKEAQDFIGTHSRWVRVAAG